MNTPTKTIKIENDVLDVLKSGEWSDDGLLFSITSQLDRQTYVKVNKVLESIGGKWSRKDKGHTFEKDPREELGVVVNSGVLIIEKDGFFETPKNVTELMIEKIGIYGKILEPEAGNGAIIDVVIKYDISSTNIILIEKNSDRCNTLRNKGYKNVLCCDFLQYNGQLLFDRIFMNPPFENQQDVEHVRYAYMLLANGGKMASVMAESVFFRDNKLSTDFREWLKCINAEVIKLPDGSFKESGTMVNTRLVIIRKEIEPTESSKDIVMNTKQLCLL